MTTARRNLVGRLSFRKLSAFCFAVGQFQDCGMAAAFFGVMPAAASPAVVLLPSPNQSNQH
jgi:hypothetical protein